MRRRDLSKWVEHDEYRKGITGAYVRVTYHRRYVLAKIDSFFQGELTYKVD